MSNVHVEWLEKRLWRTPSSSIAVGPISDSDAVALVTDEEEDGPTLVEVTDLELPEPQCYVVVQMSAEWQQRLCLRHSTGLDTIEDMV